MMNGREDKKRKSFLGVESEAKGEFITRGIFRVDGSLTGKVEADKVILGDTAFMRGDILAECIIVEGKVEGNLRATRLLEIKAKGKVKGEISAQKLLIEDGAELNGRVQMNAANEK
jgi:cytoskeletal protein CcmA (bactofilin family)